jgi:hypothetical protein
MTDVAKIAAGLRPTEVTALLGPADADMPASVSMKLSLELRLMRPCKKDANKPADLDNLTMCWTDLGLAVRAYLENPP